MSLQCSCSTSDYEIHYSSKSWIIFFHSFSLFMQTKRVICYFLTRSYKAVRRVINAGKSKVNGFDLFRFFPPFSWLAGYCAQLKHLSFCRSNLAALWLCINLELNDHIKMCEVRVQNLNTTFWSCGAEKVFKVLCVVSMVICWGFFPNPGG